MVSQNPDELRQALEAIEFEGNSRSLSVLRAEADRTVERQLEALTDIDDKASRMLRLNVLLVGVVVSALSIASQLSGGSRASRPIVEQYQNAYVELGVASLVVSTALAAITFTATEYDVGVSSDNVTTLLGADLSSAEVQALLVKNYVARINFNRSTNVRNIPLITATIVFAVVGVVLFTLGTYEATVRPVPWWLTGGAIVVVCVVVVGSGFIEQTGRAVQDIREWH